MFNLASLFVSIKADAAPLNAALDSVHSRLSTAGVAVGAFSGNVAAMLAQAATGALAGAFNSTVMAAAELNTTISKTEAILKETAGVVIAEADRMAEKYGVIKQEYLDAAATFGGAFKNAGETAAKATDMAVALTKRGMEMAERYGYSNADAFTAISSAIRGEFNTIEKFNVQINAAAIGERALAMGLTKSAAQMTQNAKIAAALSLIYEQTADAQGALDQAAGQTDNQLKMFWGTVQNLGASIGQTLIPVFNAVLSVGTSTATTLRDAWESARATFDGWAATVSDVSSTIGVIWRNMGDFVEIARIKLAEMIANAPIVAQNVADNVVQYAKYIADNWYQLIGDGINAASAIFTNFASNIFRLSKAIGTFLGDPTAGFDFNWTPLLDGFEATADELPALIRPALVSYQDEIDKVADRVARNEQNRINNLAANAGKPNAAAQQQQQQRQQQANARRASELMSASDFSARLRAAQLNGDDVAQQQLAEQRKTTDEVKKVVKAVEKKPVAVFG